MLIFLILHFQTVLPDINFCPQWKHKILLFLLLASSLVHMIPFPLDSFMVPVGCLFKCWLSALSWTFSKFPRWFLSPKSLSWSTSQSLAEGDDEVDNHLALNKQLKYVLSALKPSPFPFSRHLPALHSLQSMKKLLIKECFPDSSVGK